MLSRRSFRHSLFTLFFVGWGTVAARAGDQNAGPSVCRCARNGEWYVAETTNFSVWSRQSEESVRSLSQKCEDLRRELAGRWCGEIGADDWQPRCHVVLHADLQVYRRDCAGAAGESVGCTTLTVDNERVVFRRIDLRQDAADWDSNSLPHELTHVLLADLFAGRTLPKWLNEGLAMRSESADLQARRIDVLSAARTSRTLPSLDQLLTDARSTGRQDENVAYAASYALVEFLRSLEGDERLLEFAARVLEDGDCDAALRDCFAMSGGTSELERRWLAALAGRADSESLAER